MYDHLGWDYPETIHYGRLKVEDADLSKSKILRSILEGRVGGFDDPRLATLMALRRRGISPKALRKIAVDIGPKAVDITLSWENIYAANRKIVDRHANRYFFLKDPIELRVAEVPKTFVSRPLLHPDFPERGYRVFHLQPADGQLSLLVSRSDILHIRDEGVARLMELFNVKLSNSQRYEANYLSESLAEGREKGARLIHWLPQEGNVSVSVMMPSGAVIEGVGEPAIRSEKVDATVQLVRFGFARVDHFEDERVRLCFAHP